MDEEKWNGECPFCGFDLAGIEQDETGNKIAECLHCHRKIAVSEELTEPETTE